MQSAIYANISDSSAAAVSYACPGYFPQASQATETTFGFPVMSAAGNLNGLYVKVDTAPAAGKSWLVKVRKNAVDTALTVTISDTATSGSSTTTVAFVAGDYITYSITPSGTPTAHDGMGITMRMDSTVDKESNITGSNITNLSAVATEYLPFVGANIANATEVNSNGIVGTSGTIKNLYVKLGTTPGVGSTRTFTVVKNGTNTGVTLTIANPDTTGSDLTHSFTVAAGDLLSLESAIGVAPAASKVGFGATFLADTAGESLIMADTNGGSPDNTNPNYTTLNYAAPGATETNFDVGFACTLKKMYVKLDSAPGAGNTLTFDVRVNSASPASDVSVAIVDANTTGNDTTNTVAVVDGDKLGIRVVPNSTPTVSPYRFGLVQVFADSSSGGFKNLLLMGVG